VNYLQNSDVRIENDREEIDGLDAAIIELLQRRMRISQRIQRQRMSGGGPRTVLAREMTVLHRYRSEFGASGTAIAMNVLELCRGAARMPAAADAEATAVSAQDPG
jgi:chorismate mutase